MPIKNFCIIAHIDHGKSTLADRMLEVTGTIPQREMRDQLLDTMDLERERGITIKLQPVRMNWKGHQLNLIDTPGHIDFNYEVSRALAAVDGAILLVDASQGVEAQTLANLYLALEQNLAIIPVINKIDLPAADVISVTRELVSLLGCKTDEVMSISAKTGSGVVELLDAILSRIPAAPQELEKQLQALIFDAQYDEYKGVVIFVRQFRGLLIAGQKIRFLKTGMHAEILEVGYFRPQRTAMRELRAGEIGYVVTNIKDIEQARVGDTIVLEDDRTTAAMKGYRETVPMVYAGVFPDEGTPYEKIRKAVEKLKLNDASLHFNPEHSEVFGFGFRCGFLGLLHLEIFQERLRREYGLPVIITAPTVAYHVITSADEFFTLTSPSELPDEHKRLRIEQPIVHIELITPKRYMGSLMEYMQGARANFAGTEFIEAERVIIRARLPLNNVIIDFYDRIKNLSSGYASYTYEVVGYEPCDVEKLEILVAEEQVPALTTIVPADELQRRARAIVSKLKDILPRQQFVLKIQAAVGGKIIAAERLSALRKDVTAKLYGGDVTRKRKLLEKQKKGKRRMLSRGSVRIPHEAYLAVLRRD